MKQLKIKPLTYLFFFFFFSCGDSATDSEKAVVKKDPGSYQKISVSECIKRILYIENQTDVNKYDSISIHYFHELKDYIEPEAIALKRKLDSLNKIIHKLNEANDDPSMLYHLTDSIKAELSPYQKFVIGYAFVHTFFDGKDTSSAIFVMDTLCGFGEMTLIKEKILTDPIEDMDYASKIRSDKVK